MKNILGLIILFFLATTPARAHLFGPVDQINIRGYETTLINMRLKSDRNDYYAFSVGDVTKVDSKGNPVKMYVMAGMEAIFPMTISNKYIKNDHIKICSWPLDAQSQFTGKVCFDVRV